MANCNCLKDKKIGVISLGCDKNRVDSEYMLGILSSNGINITSNIDEAQIIVVNTCAFLCSSREEAINTILDCARKKNKNLEKLVVSGCLSQKFVNELFLELPEVDLFLGFKDYDSLIYGLEECYQGKRLNLVGTNEKVTERKRIITTPLHYAYLKIADGCDNFCTYCLIPSIRGKYKSENFEELISEAKSLGDLAELILVAQDVTRYGTDLYGKNRLVELLKALSELENIEKIRLLYCYPDMISDELIAEIRDNDKIIKYIDIPLQHSEDRVLKRMNRKGDRASYLKLIDKLRREIPSIAIRSTFITGFPDETESEFENLKDFLLQARLMNAGFFAYSREEGTPAYKLKNQIPQRVKNKRVKELYALQNKITSSTLKEYIGKTLEVLCDGIDYDKQKFVGRAYFSAPDIDTLVYFVGNEVCQGKRYKVRIIKEKNLDLYGVID